MDNDIYKIKIEGDNSCLLSVTLSDILAAFNGQEYCWSMLWLWAVGDLMPEWSVLDLEEQANNNPNGFRIDWDELKMIADRVSQVMELLLIGSRSIPSLKRYQTDEDMYNTCDIVIELIDSSYWIIHTRDKEVFDQIKAKLPGSY